MDKINVLADTIGPMAIALGVVVVPFLGLLAIMVWVERRNTQTKMKILETCVWAVRAHMRAHGQDEEWTRGVLDKDSQVVETWASANLVQPETILGYAMTALGGIGTVLILAGVFTGQVSADALFVPPFATATVLMAGIRMVRIFSRS